MTHSAHLEPAAPRRSYPHSDIISTTGPDTRTQPQRSRPGGGAPLREAIARIADRHAEDLRAVVEDIRASGVTSLRDMAAEMNARGILTRRGGRWHVSTVRNLLRRLNKPIDEPEITAAR